VEVIEGILCRYSEKNTIAIKKYIANQLKQDKEVNQLSVFDPNDPFCIPYKWLKLLPLA
jgi:hypothetical protein